jgi:hypothetical protein
MYRERNRIERMIGHLKINRAITTRYDEVAAPSSTRFILPLSADAYAMQLCKQRLIDPLPVRHSILLASSISKCYIV